MIPTTVIFKTQDHSKSTVDGLHSWVTTKIRKGNNQDRAQTIADVITFLQEEEEKKLYGSIKRYFLMTQNVEEPRKGLKNSSSIHNHLIRMCTYNSAEQNLSLTDIPCTCKSCIFGQFKDCSIYKHNIVKVAFLIHFMVFFTSSTYFESMLS